MVLESAASLYALKTAVTVNFTTIEYIYTYKITCFCEKYIFNLVFYELIALSLPQ